MAQFSTAQVTAVIRDAQTQINAALADLYSLPFLTDTDLSPTGNEAALQAVLDSGNLPVRIELIARYLASGLLQERLISPYAVEKATDMGTGDIQTAYSWLQNIKVDRPTLSLVHSPLVPAYGPSAGSQMTQAEKAESPDKTPWVQEEGEQWQP